MLKFIIFVLIFSFFDFLGFNISKGEETKIENHSETNFSNRYSTDASVLFNTALDFNQKKNIGLALAYLRQGQLLSPRHQGIRQALDFVLNTTKTKELLEENSILSQYESSFSDYFLLPEILTFHWTVSFFALLIFGKLFRNRRKAHLLLEIPPKMNFWHWGLFATWSLLSCVLLLKIVGSIDQRATIIHSKSVAIRSGPVPDAAELFDISEGANVIVKDYYKDWAQIKFGQYPVGWVFRNDLLLLTPDGFR